MRVLIQLGFKPRSPIEALLPGLLSTAPEIILHKSGSSRANSRNVSYASLSTGLALQHSFVLPGRVATKITSRNLLIITWGSCRSLSPRLENIKSLSPRLEIIKSLSLRLENIKSLSPFCQITHLQSLLGKSYTFKTN